MKTMEHAFKSLYVGIAACYHLKGRRSRTQSWFRIGLSVMGNEGVLFVG